MVSCPQYGLTCFRLGRLVEKGEARNVDDCADCYGGGLVFTRNSKGVGKVYACHCPKGAPNREAMFFPNDKKRERPFFMEVFGEPRGSRVKPAGSSEGETKPPPDRMPYKDD